MGIESLITFGIGSSPGGVGSFVLFGLSPNIGIFSHTATGGMTAGGTSIVSRTYVFVANGGLTSSGNAIITNNGKISYSHSAIGGIVISGSCALNRTFSSSAIGGLVTSGMAIVVQQMIQITQILTSLERTFSVMGDMRIFSVSSE